jgi:hypothetical protein
MSLDRLAIAVSTLCVFHCILVPATVVLVPTLGGLLGSDETFHRTLVLFIVPSTVLALGLGCSRHSDRRVFFLGVAGIGMLLLTLGLGHVERWEKVGTAAGSVLVLLGQLRNYRLCRATECAHGLEDRGTQ